MIDTLSLFTTDPLKAIAVCAVFLATYFIIAFRKRLEHDFISFENKMNVWITTLSKHMAETKGELHLHSENLGKATKAVNGDMLKIKENIFALKEELSIKIHELQSFIGTQKMELETLSQMNAIAIERFEEKFGRILEIKKEMETLQGKIIKIEESNGQFHITVSNRFKHVAEILKDHERVLKK